jgi:acetyl-CoA C-acetyltransferase
MGALSRKSAIVGAYEFPLRLAPGYTPVKMEAECAKHALDEAGLTIADVDGIWGLTAPVPESGSGITMCDYFDVHPKWVSDTNIGGASYLHHITEATAMIAAGHIEVALITYSQVSSSRGVRIGTGGGRTPGAAFRPRREPWYTDAFHNIYGINTVSSYAQVAQRHMYEYGTTSEQLAEIAVAMRYHAGFNPDAKYRDPITVDDVVNSRLVCSPLHLLDCCMVSDGGGAIVVASAERARTVKTKPIWYLGGATAVEHRSGGYRDYTQQAAMQCGPRAFADAGLTHKDIDTAQLYDSFTITVLTTLEGLGFAKKGEGGQFVQGGRLRLDGDLPTNTDGGGLSSNHPGARGMFLAIEATRQLRGGLGERQVKDAEVAICHGTGFSLGVNHSGSTAFLTNR